MYIHIYYMVHLGIDNKPIIIYDLSNMQWAINCEYV